MSLDQDFSILLGSCQTLGVHTKQSLVPSLLKSKGPIRLTLFPLKTPSMIMSIRDIKDILNKATTLSGPSAASETIPPKTSNGAHINSKNSTGEEKPSSLSQEKSD